jgi:hypothetical protein
MTKKLVLLISVFVLVLALSLLSACGRHPGTTKEVTESSTDSTITELTPTETTGKKPTPTHTATPTPTPFVFPENVDFVIEPVFDEAEAFNAFGYAVVGVETNEIMKYGMINEAGEFVIAPEYESYRIPKEMKITQPEADIGYTWLQKDGLWGFVNEKCEWVVDCKYDDCLFFTEIGFSGVEVDGKWGFISTSGKMVVEPVYDHVQMCCGDDYVAVCKDELWGLIDSNGKVIFVPSASYLITDGDYGEHGYWSSAGYDLILTGDDYSGLISFDGEMIVQNSTTWIYSISSNGLVFADSPTDGTGYFNAEGELVIPLQKNEYGNMFQDNGLAIVETQAEDGSRTYRYINTSGKTVIDGKFEKAYDFAPNGIASVKEDGLYGYIDMTGSYVIEPQFEDGWDFDANGFAVVMKNGKWAIMDDTGKLNTDYIFDDWSQPYYDELPVSVFEVEVDGQVGLVNAFGETLLEPQFDHIIFSYPKSMEGWNIINYSDADLAMTYEHGKYGIISLQGEILLEAVNDGGYILVSENGYSAVSINGKYGYVDVVD